MTEGPLEVLWVTGRVSAARARRLDRLADRLEDRGISLRVLAIGLDDPRSAGERSSMAPGLGVGWRRVWTCRQLTGRAGLARPHLIHAIDTEAHEPSRLLAARWDLPYILGISDFMPPGGRARQNWGRCRAVLAADSELALDLIQHQGFPGRLVRVVLPAVEPLGPANRPAEVVGDSPMARAVRVVGMAGRLVAGAGGTTLLEAASRLSNAGLDFEVVLAGLGPAEVALRELADRLGIADRVTFADDPEAHETFWEAIDVYCQPALSPTTGRPLLEALARGLPVVGSDAPGLSGHFEDRLSGLRFPAGDVPALAEALRTLLDDPARAAAIGEAGRERIARLRDPGREADALAAAYREAVETVEPTAPTVARSLRLDSGSGSRAEVS